MPLCKFYPVLSGENVILPGGKRMDSRYIQSTALLGENMVWQKQSFVRRI